MNVVKAFLKTDTDFKFQILGSILFHSSLVDRINEFLKNYITFWI